MINDDIWHQLPKHFLCLAPMEGVTDSLFRQVVAKASRPDLFFTEFTNVSSYASPKGRANALERFTITPTDPPIIAQIWGKTPEHYSVTAHALKSLGFSGIDINMGCPDRHVIHAGGGSAMIRTPELAVECIQSAYKNAEHLPVSVKTRLGYTSVDEYKTWLPTLLQQNLSALTIHLRTKKEMSKVPAHHELIPDIVTLKNQVAPDTKLIINGDIKDKHHAEQIFNQYPDIDGIMIGRGVFANPYCFTDHQPIQQELLDLLNYHLDLFEQHPPHSFEPLKHYFKIYINNFPGASALRAKLMECHSVEEARKILMH